ncbi:phosphate-starvation-inducible PsiE family protein [Vibrio crassostreae]|uniref:phosphate-starvation-inducible PsiE family protein n=1 Tax=Vibrio crassostreae TaxID=246167 RepID=UPI002E1707BB|nr:phosphate-starvation-inducible PsiE family protein [Vibrio crassostreae]
MLCEKTFFSKILHLTELAIVALVFMNTIIAVYYETVHLITTRQVVLTDILMLFLYLEILAMIKDYINTGEITLKYPIYIAVISIARFVILSIKDLTTIDIVWLSLSIFILSLSVIGLASEYNFNKNK